MYNKNVAQDKPEVAVAEVSEIDDLDPLYEGIKSAFYDSVEKGEEEDDTKMAMIAAGAKFKSVNRMFNRLMIEFGYALSKDDKEDVLDQVLDGLDLTDVDTFDSAVSELAQRIQTSERSAAGSLRQWAKKKALPFFIKPKVEVTKRTGITAAIYGWIVDNADASPEDLYAVISNIGTENTMRNKTHFCAVLKMANEIAAKYS